MENEIKLKAYKAVGYITVGFSVSCCIPLSLLLQYSYHTLSYHSLSCIVTRYIVVIVLLH